MNDHVYVALSEHCEMVARGCKPLSLMPVMTKNKTAILAFLNSTGLSYKLDDLAEGWATLYVYKHPLIEKIIDMLPDEPKTALDHTVLGFLLGYDINSILDFLTLHKLV